LKTLHLTADDLVNMRFAYSPTLEIPFSYQTLRNPAFHYAHRRWVQEAQQALCEEELPYLSALVPPIGYIPDFLNPTPTTNHTDIERDFEALLATPDEVIRKNVLSLIQFDGDSEMRRYFVAHPREAVVCLVEDLRLYWQRTLAHHWSRIISRLEGDILSRARILALHGADVLFTDLHPTISFRRNNLQVQYVYHCADQNDNYQLTGEGLRLVPTLFANRVMAQIPPHQLPMLAYATRETGQWHSRLETGSLELALGAARASVLQTLTHPSTTGEIAYKLSLTSGAVSQQLQRLVRAGLAEAHRNGKRVFYRLTRRGEDLIALFERI
jgi:DNA-binding MarR family transcriptional regulator